MNVQTKFHLPQWVKTCLIRAYNTVVPKCPQEISLSARECWLEEQIKVSEADSTILEVNIIFTPKECCTLVTVDLGGEEVAVVVNRSPYIPGGQFMCKSLYKEIK